MTYTKRFAVLMSGIVILVLPEAGAHGQDPQQIMDKSYHAGRVADAQMVSTLNLYNEKGQVRVRKTAAVSKLFDNGKTDKRLIQFISPADVKGTKFMTYDYEDRDDDIWMYLPSLRKSRRIVSTEKSKSFMGSEFSYVDITPRTVAEYNYKLLKEEKQGGVDCWVIEALPKSDKIGEEDGYSKRIAWIGKPDYVLRKAIFYDLDNRLLKEVFAEDIRQIDAANAKFRPFKMTAVNKQNGRKSEFIIEKLVANTGVKDDYFSIRYLER